YTVLQQEYQPRDDYRELLELVLLFAGEKPGKEVTFHSPEAEQSEAWMFRGQFPLTELPEKGLRQLCIFGFNIYIKRWIGAATIAAISPREDLNLFHELRALSKEGLLEQEAAAAFQKLKGALWYLSDRLIPLAIFDDQLSFKEKEDIAIAQIETTKKPSKNNIRWRHSPADIEETTGLADLITTDSIQFYDMDFLTLQVTNEIAERGVAMARDYSSMCKAE
ncbi:hypothetical protein FOCC_FOCC013245, partial [Frankliniella occidentalis]